jgi:hypothetical protein
MHLQDPARLAQAWDAIGVLHIPREYDALLSYFIRRLPHNRGDGRLTFLDSWAAIGEGSPPEIDFGGMGKIYSSREGVTPGSYGAKERAIIDLVKWFGIVAQQEDNAKKAYGGALGYESLGPTRPRKP